MIVFFLFSFAAFQSVTNKPVFHAQFKKCEKNIIERFTSKNENKELVYANRVNQTIV